MRRANRTEPITHPMRAMMTRTMPAQKSHMQRPASHHDISSVVRKPPRPERKGMVYSDSIVHQEPAISTSTGMSSRTSAPTKAGDTSRDQTKCARAVCHSASHRRGAVNARTAMRHWPGKSAANDSNMSRPRRRMCDA